MKTFRNIGVIGVAVAYALGAVGCSATDEPDGSESSLPPGMEKEQEGVVGNGGDDAESKIHMIPEQFDATERISADLNGLAVALDASVATGSLPDALSTVWREHRGAFRSVDLDAVGSANDGSVAVPAVALQGLGENIRAVTPFFEALDSVTVLPSSLQEVLAKMEETVDIVMSTQGFAEDELVEKALRKQFCCVMEATGPWPNSDDYANKCINIKAFPRLASGRCAAWAATQVVLLPTVAAVYDSVLTRRSKCGSVPQCNE